MAALTADVIVDRVRSIVTSHPFNFAEAESWASFDLQPDTNIDGVVRIPPMVSQFVSGGFDFTEDRTDSMQIWVARTRNGDYDQVRRLLARDVHSLTSAIMRDGAITSGDYDVRDGGRGHAIAEDRGQVYVALRLTLPINFDAQF